jgi:photosystem II stability/assembly factor-like uncharacterized protein
MASESPPLIETETTEEAPEIEPPTATATVTETLIPSDTPTATFTNTPSLPMFADPVIFNLAMFTPLQGWAVTQYDDFLLVTMDGGQTWFDTTPSGLSTLNARPFFLDENTAWFTPGNSGMIYHTQDGGVNWMTATLPFDGAGYFFLDADNGYALVPLGAGAGSHYVALYRTLDGGSSWTQIFTHEPGESKSLPESGTKNGITFLDMNHAWVGGSYPMEDYFYLHYSEDGGASWSREMGIILPAPYAGSWLDVWQPFFLSSTAGFLPVRALAPDGNQYLLVYSSDDSGQTWSFANSVQDGRDLDFVTVDHGWVASGLGLFHTTDGGTNWSIVTGSGLPAGEFFLKVDFVDDQNGWVITTPDDSTWSPLKLLRTTDGGSNWTQLLP